MSQSASPERRRHRWRRTLLRIWLAGSIVWCALVAILAYSEWQAYRRAAFSFESGLGAQTEAPEPPPPGFHLVETTMRGFDHRMGHTEAMLLFFLIVAILPPACALALGWLARKAGAL